jgi:hypothetical protein
VGIRCRGDETREGSREDGRRGIQVGGTRGFGDVCWIITWVKVCIGTLVRVLLLRGRTYHGQIVSRVKVMVDSYGILASVYVYACHER